MYDAIHGQPLCCDGGSSHCQGAEPQSSSEPEPVLVLPAGGSQVVTADTFY